jgi:hypothetical protein
MSVTTMDMRPCFGIPPARFRMAFIARSGLLARWQQKQ